MKTLSLILLGFALALVLAAPSAPWGDPAKMATERISFGWQAGGEATDFVPPLMNGRGPNSLLKSKATLGSDTTVGAPPKERMTNTKTDGSMGAEILSYSRSRGIFAGIALRGATLHHGTDGDAALYGREITARQIIDGRPTVPTAARVLLSELDEGIAAHGGLRLSTGVDDAIFKGDGDEQ